MRSPSGSGCALRYPERWIAYAFILGASAAFLAISARAESETEQRESMLGETEILNRAFSNRYDLSFTAEIELDIELRGTEARRRVFFVATLHDEGIYRALGQLTWPEYLRGMTLLSISEGSDDHQAFVYLPSQSRVRRISSTRRDDAFLGSDLTYEDFERRRVEDYEVALLADSEIGGEPVFVVEGRPVAKLNYNRAEFLIAKEDWAILEIREFRRGSDDPVRRMTALRQGMQAISGHVMATQLVFETLSRSTATRVAFKNLRAQRVRQRFFTVGSLQRAASLKTATRCESLTPDCE